MKQAPVIVFVCEHGAAKSVVAAAHFNQIARETGLRVHAIARGTDPQPALSAGALTGLQADGLEPAEPRPRRLEPPDVAAARQVISFCPLPQEIERQMRIEHWDDVPSVAEDYERSRDAIVAHIQELVTSL